MVAEETKRVRPLPLAWTVWVARGIYLTLFIIGIVFYENLQEIVDTTYAYLLTTWFFNSTYFETLWTVMVYPVILVAPAIMDQMKAFDKFKLEKRVFWPADSRWQQLFEAVQYAAPLMFLDTVLVKRYWEVDPVEWDSRKVKWIQDTRALPQHAPTVFQIFYQLLISFILYDAMFCGVHYFLHKNKWGYKYLHSWHHDHDVIYSRVTNQLTVLERVLLVLTANYALKMVRGHPLTRAIFVPFFLGAITENHCGYDLPWTLDKVVPGGLVGGSPRHYAHHADGSRNYQPFFTYIDDYLNRKQESRNKNR